MHIYTKTRIRAVLLSQFNARQQEHKVTSWFILRTNINKERQRDKPHRCALSILNCGNGWTSLGRRPHIEYLEVYGSQLCISWSQICRGVTANYGDDFAKDPCWLSFCTRRKRHKRLRSKERTCHAREGKPSVYSYYRHDCERMARYREARLLEFFTIMFLGESGEKLVGVSMEPLAEHSWGNRCTFIMSICSNLYPWEVTGLASSRHFELWAPPMGWLSGPFIEDRGVNSSTSQTRVLQRTVSQCDTYHLVILTALLPSYHCKLRLSYAGTICFVI